MGINFGELETAIGLRPEARTIGGLISSFLPLIWSSAGIILLIYLVLGGFQFLTSEGDPKKIAVAQAKITSAIVGLIIVLSAFWIVELVGIFLGIDAITSTSGIFN